MIKAPVRVLFLTRYPREGASSRYRVHQYIPELRKHGVIGKVQSFMDRDMYQLSLSSGNTLRKVLATCRACWRRLKELSRWKNFDVIYMQRELFPLGPPIIEYILKLLGARLMFDYDDALFIKKDSRYNPIASRLRSADKTRQILKLVDCTVAGNNWLRDQARAEGGIAETVEVAEDVARFVAPGDKFAGTRREVTIGWLGSPSTAKYLREIEPVLQKLAAKYPEVRWELMGSGAFSQDGVPWQVLDWSIAQEREALSRYDIGIMPLPDQDWSRGKSGGKARTYMAAAVVPVVQAIGYNQELIRDGETGFLCRTETDWQSAIERLIADRGLREKIATAARRDVEARFSLSGQARELACVIRRVAPAGGRA